MNNARISEMKQMLEKYRNGVAFQCICKSPDAELTDTGLCIKYAYELLDALDTPNDKAEPQRAEDSKMEPQRNPAVGSSALVRPLCVTLQNGDIIERPSGYRQIYNNGRITNDAPKMSIFSSLMRWISRHCERLSRDETCEQRLSLYISRLHPIQRIRQYEERSSTQQSVQILHCL